MKSWFVALLTSLLITAGVSAACAAELRVIASGDLTEAFLELMPKFERATHYKVVTSFGASVGGASDSVPKRVEHGELADVVILARSGLDQLVKEVAVRNRPIRTPMDFERTVTFAIDNDLAGIAQRVHETPGE
jgi:ABC-type molybdate transport system substrate-binding protein